MSNNAVGWPRSILGGETMTLSTALKNCSAATLSILRKGFGLAAGAVLVSAFSAAAIAGEATTVGETALKLINGWKVYNAYVSKPSVTLVNGIVHFEGTIATTHSNIAPFVLPAGFRPANTVYVPIDLSGATHGQLQILSNGQTFVQAQNGQFAKAGALTSLEGVVFAKGTGGTLLTMLNGWSSAPYGTATATVRIAGGIVYLAGGIDTSGTNPQPFTLPASFAPAKTVYVPVDLYNQANGRLEISSNGTVVVQAEGGAFSNAANFTSLDGVSFARTAAGATPLTLINGWTGAPYGTGQPSVYLNNGIIHLEGAIATSGTNSTAFVLPSGYRPTSPVYLQVDLCGVTNGDLFIRTTGGVEVRAEGGQFGNAKCFTSLDRASFAQ
jgi:hypothetical protein